MCLLLIPLIIFAAGYYANIKHFDYVCCTLEMCFIYYLSIFSITEHFYLTA